MKIKHLTLCALCVALGIALPVVLHAIPNAGGVFLPMHIPVLICGLICGAPYGMAAGVLTPLLSGLLTGMPPPAVLPGMLCELAAYGLISGLLLRFVRTRRPAADTVIALLGAMAAGRLISGILNALIFRAGAYSLSMWLSASFVTALPGIVIQIVVIPAVIQVLYRVRALDRTEIAWAPKPGRGNA